MMSIIRFRNGVLLSFLIFPLSYCQPKLENPTDDFLPGHPIATLKNKKLDEISGISASWSNKGFIWAHNDSGNDAELFLIDNKLNIRLTCTFGKLKNRDWEDMAVGPGPEPGKNYVYVGEIGDNNSVYPLKYIYRFEEPVVQEGVAKMEITKFDTITFRLPDKQKDAETLLIDPKTKDLIVISKREKPVWVYQLAYPQSTSDTITATKNFSIPLTQMVGGDVSANGEEIVLKNYQNIYYWKSDGNKSVLELLKEKPLDVPYETEPQGEAITWLHDNSGFYTLSEKNIGKKTYLYFYRRRD